MPQDNPPLLDKTMNTTESTPRNLADVLASGLANIANNVKPDGSDISIDVPGMSANNVDDGFSELKQSLDGLSKWENVYFQTYKNQTTFEIPITAQAGASHFGTYALFNGNCDVLLVIEVGSSSHVKVVSASNRTFTLNVTSDKATITASAGLWGMTFIIGYFE